MSKLVINIADNVKKSVKAKGIFHKTLAKLEKVVFDMSEQTGDIDEAIKDLHTEKNVIQKQIDEDEIFIGKLKDMIGITSIQEDEEEPIIKEIIEIESKKQE